MQITPQIHIVDGVAAPKGGWKYLESHKAEPRTSTRFYHQRFKSYNPAILIDGSALTMIDAGPPESLPQTKKCIEGLGFQLRDIKSIIVTYAAADHTGELKHLVDLTGAKVYAHEAEVPYILRKAFREQRHIEAANVDVLLKDGDLLDILGGLKVIHTPGHARGHIIPYLLKQKALFAAGLMRTLKGQILLWPPQYCDDYTEVIKSMIKIARYDFDILVPYQGEPIIGGAGDKLRELIEYLKAISDIFLPSIREALAPEIEGGN